MHIARDHTPPYIFTVEYDDDDELHDYDFELLCRSELVARGHRLDETAWPQWRAGAPNAPDAPHEEAVLVGLAPTPTQAPGGRRLPATVVTWNCGGLMIKMHEVDNLIKFKHPDIIFLTETFLLKVTLPLIRFLTIYTVKSKSSWSKNFSKIYFFAKPF